MPHTYMDPLSKSCPAKPKTPPTPEYAPLRWDVCHEGLGGWFVLRGKGLVRIQAPANGVFRHHVTAVRSLFLGFGLTKTPLTQDQLPTLWRHMVGQQDVPVLAFEARET